jgi:hypothetical protein
MRKIKDVIAEFRTRPIGYWFGIDPPCSYELRGQAILKRFGDTEQDFATVPAIVSWKSLSRKQIAVRLQDYTLIVSDGSATLRSILREVAADIEDRDSCGELSLD